MKNFIARFIENLNQLFSLHSPLIVNMKIEFAGEEIYLPRKVTHFALINSLVEFLYDTPLPVVYIIIIVPHILAGKLDIKPLVLQISCLHCHSIFVYLLSLHS